MSYLGTETDFQNAVHIKIMNKYTLSSQSPTAAAPLDHFLIQFIFTSSQH